MDQTRRLAPRSEKGLLTPDNCVVTLIDLQPQMLFGVSGADRQAIVSNNTALAKSARVFGVPLVVSTVETRSFSGYMWPQISAIVPDQTPIERTTMNAWDHAGFVQAVTATGRKKIVLAGLWTETCVALPTIQAIHDGYEVYIVEDCCGDVSELAHRNAMQRVIQAGAVPVTALSVMLEWQRDWAARETYDAVMDIVKTHFGAYGAGVEYAFNMELRWEGVRSLADGLRMLRIQAQRTPPPQWVRVVGGWSEFQFAERRLPTLDEINAAAPDTPVFVLHLYDRAWLNGAALRAVGYTRETPDPPGATIERDRHGHPTGLLLAQPNAGLLYATLAKGPRLSVEDQVNSTRHFMRELNRLGVTSVIDAGGGFQNYPDDYPVIERLHRDGLLTLRIAYNLFTQRPGGELADFERWTAMAAPYQGDARLRLNGAGEMLAFSAADFEDFLQPRPDLAPRMEADLEAVVRHLAGHGWPFRLHATYDESITRMLDVFERVHREVPLNGLRWLLDHAETISPRNLARVAALGGGIAVQHRMAFQGEHFVDRYGAAAAEAAPPVRRMLDEGVPVGAGTDATRVASYNPWVALSWLTTGRTRGGLTLYPHANRLDREAALALFTRGSAWMSREDDVKGRIAVGQYADLAVLSADYFDVPEDAIADLTAVLTVVDGEIVHGSGEYAPLAPALPPPSPDWSPVGRSDAGPAPASTLARRADGLRCTGHAHANGAPSTADRSSFWGPHGCGCWAF